MQLDDGNFNLQQLEYFQQIQRRHTWMARALLLSVLVGLLGISMWMTQRNYEAMLINVDQARLAQVNLFEAEMARLKKVEAKVDLLYRAQQKRPQAAMVSTAR